VLPLLWSGYSLASFILLNGYASTGHYGNKAQRLSWA